MGVLEAFPRITPFLWFDVNAEEAVDLYVGVFKNSRRLEAVRNSDETQPRKVVFSPSPSNWMARSLRH
jgi:predicted 3-demethylubiquinone-9 3-methyltransferase (glyoxalase superfamily)